MGDGHLIDSLRPKILFIKNKCHCHICVCVTVSCAMGRCLRRLVAPEWLQPGVVLVTSGARQRERLFRFPLSCNLTGKIERGKPEEDAVPRSGTL